MIKGQELIFAGVLQLQESKIAKCQELLLNYNQSKELN